MKKLFYAGALLLPLASGSLFAEGSYSFGVGADYSRGDYGTGSTATLVSIPFSLAYQGTGWGWGVSVPYLSLRSSGNVTVGAGGMIGTGPASAGSSGSGAGPGGGGGGSSTATTTTTESGLGDVTLRLSLELAEEGRVMPWLGLTLKSKLATADETRHLGTGQNDYAAQLEWAKGHVDGYFGYKVLGDTAIINFNNVAYGALALSHESSEATRFTLEGYMEQAAISGLDGKREASLIFDHWLDDEKKISGYLMKGFSDASPDWGAGLSIKYAL